jgi:acyl-CoA thioester hydrolase
MIKENGYNVTEIRVRYADTDKMGLAYNGNYLAWFEIGRTEFLRELGITYKKTEESGYYLPLTEAYIKYLKPICYDDVIIIKTYIGKKPGLRIRMNYEIYKDSDLVSSGYTEHVFTNSLLKPIKPSGEFMNIIGEIWKKHTNMETNNKND